MEEIEQDTASTILPEDSISAVNSPIQGGGAKRKRQGTKVTKIDLAIQNKEARRDKNGHLLCNLCVGVKPINRDHNWTSHTITEKHKQHLERLQNPPKLKQPKLDFFNQTIIKAFQQTIIKAFTRNFYSSFAIV